MAVPTTLQLGYTNPLTDNFGAHPSSPTGTILDLNDGTTFSLVDDSSGMGRGLDLGTPLPTVLDVGNPRTVGRRVVRRVYDKNRKVTAKLFWGQGSSWTAWNAALHNLQRLCEAITEANPATLKVQPAGSSTPVYFDVKEAHVHTSMKELLWQQLVDDEVTVEFICRSPFARGARQWLANAAVNPGFEAPSGPGVAVFTDPLTTFNAYATQAGAAPSAPAISGYYDAVLADTPLRYYRLSELTGTAANDATGSANAGTYTGSPTLGVTGLLTGDPDLAATFNGTSQYVTLPAAGIPTGNAAWTLECWFKIAANPSGNAVLMNIGANSANANATLYLDNTGKAHVGVNQIVTFLSSAAGVALNTPHHLVGTWDGTTLRGWLDNVSLGTATPAALAITGNNQYLAAYAGGVSLFPGTLDECAIYTAALSSTRVGAHYTAGTTTPTNLAGTMALPTGTRVAFGSPAWGCVNTWQVRVQPQPETTLSFYLHYTDASNYLEVRLTGKTSLVINQAVAGTVHALASAQTFALSGVWYWLQITLFPSVTGNPPQVQAVLSTDNAGAINTTVTTFGPVATFDALTALTGRPQIATSGGPAALGGNFTGTHTLSLFGPGGWTLVPSQNSATGYVSGAWDTSWGNPTVSSPTTYPNGPVTSFGAARVDLPPAGTVDTLWHLYAGGAPAGTQAIPVQTAGNVLGYSVAVRGSGLHATNASVAVVITEYNSSGTATGSASGNLTTTLGGAINGAWVVLSGSYTTHTNCAYVDLALRVVDTSVAGESANATVWWDNVQVWDQTRTGMPTMPYCELRFPQAPAQVVVSGLLGDVPAPAWVGIATYQASWNNSSSPLTLAFGRRAQPQASGQLVTNLYDTNTATRVLDTTAYGGYYLTSGSPPPFQVPGLLNAATQGVYHLWARAWSADSPITSVGIALSLFDTPQASWNGTAYDEIDYAARFLLTSGSTWTVCDVGQVLVPIAARGALNDLTQSYLIQWLYFSGVGAPGHRGNWALLLPVDASTLIAKLSNGGGFAPSLTNSWVWLYSDPGNPSPAWSTSATTAPIPAPAVGFGTGGSGASQNINPTGDPTVLLDPTSVVNGVSVNQCGLSLTDGNGTVLPAVAELIYSPLYQFPL